MAEKMDMLLEAARLGGRVDLMTREELLRDLLSRWTLELRAEAQTQEDRTAATQILDGPDPEMETLLAGKVSAFHDIGGWLERKAEEVKNGK